MTAAAERDAGVRMDARLVSFEPRDEGGRAVYRGRFVTRELDVPFEAVATIAKVDIQLLGEAGALESTLVKLAAPLLRAATRVELAAGEPPPRRITRWRRLAA
ncbi:MAG: hypothetical protein U0271_25115 [Polyangiaceae bacterium]